MVWELWPYEVEGPSYDWLETPKGQRSQSACKEDYLNNKVKWQSQRGLFK